MSRVMLIGLGDLGGVILDLLARESKIREIVVGARNLQTAQARCNLSVVSAVAAGHAPRINLVHVDLDTPEQVAEAINRCQPDVLLSTATMLTWWAPELLSPGPASALRKAAFAAWLPAHLSPTMKFMTAVRMARHKAITLTAPFPDAVNCVLGKLGLAPDCGIGNIDEIVAKVRFLVAEKLNVTVDQVTIRMVAHHALESLVFGAGGRNSTVPYLLRIEHNGSDVTDIVGAEDMLFSPFPLASGRVTHVLTAGSVVSLIRALLDEKETLTHVPGPAGLPGGYPVRVSRKGIVVDVAPFGMSEAIGVNVRSQPFDGIEAILDDGTVIVAEESAAVLKSQLGVDVRKVAPIAVHEQAIQLVSKFGEFAARCGAATLQN